VRFGEPVALRAALAGGDPHALSKVAFEVCTRINRATPITPISLVTLALLGAEGRAVTVAQAQALVDPVRRYVTLRGLPVSEQGLETERVLETLVEHGVVEAYAGGAEPVYRIRADRNLAAAFYRNYRHVAEALVESGAAVYAGDHLGHGRSEGERVSIADMEDLVADVHRVVEAARGEHPGLPVVLIGRSLGSLVAARYAQQHGDGLAALVLSAPVVGGNPDLLGMVALPEIPDVPIDPEWLSRDPEVGRAYADDELVWHGPFKRETLQAIVDSIEHVAAGGDLGELPTLWIHGEEDVLAPLAHARPAVERIRGSALEEKVYPGARHEVLNETNKDEVIGDVTAFVKGALS
jgi:alpha-beta hydrolase superfamily lysophospholipase